MATDQARAYPTSNAQTDHRTTVTSPQRLPYQERVRDSCHIGRTKSCGMLWESNMDLSVQPLGGQSEKNEN